MADPHKPCRDCPPDSSRPAPHPGPRCATHWRVESRRRRDAAHDRKVQVVYGLDEGEYERLWAAQGGLCPICRRATGRTRRLSVDEDHRLAGRASVRGLLCRPCNSMLGHARDDPEFFLRAIAYLADPPARALLGGGGSLDPKPERNDPPP